MSYFLWHFVIAPRNILRITRNFIIFFYHYFSIPLLLKTLFAPWKKLYRARDHAGFSPSDFFERLSFNLISRCIGLLLRLFVINTGLLCIALTIAIGATFSLLWLCIPFLTYPLYWRTTQKQQNIVLPAKTTHEYLERFLKSPAGQFLCARLLIKPEELKKVLEPNLPVPQAPHPLIIPDSGNLKKFFQDRDIEESDLQNIANWFTTLEQENKKKAAFWELDYLLHIPSIGKQWTYGYTPTVDQFTTDLSLEPISFGKYVGRKAEIEKIETTLSKHSDNSVFVMGEPGVGKHALITYLAHLVDEGRVYPTLESKRLLRLDLERVLHGGDITSSKSTLTQLLDEAHDASNIILVIDEFDRYVSSREDRIDLTDVFLHQIADGRLQILAIVNPGAYEQYIRPNTQLSDAFEVVEVKEPDTAETLNIIEAIVPMFEVEGVFFSYPALKTLVTQAGRFIKETPNPEKSIDLLDAASTTGKLKSKGTRIITSEDIEKIVSDRIKMPITATKNERQTLLNLESLLHERVIAQDEAITAVSHALRRARTDVSARKNKPFGSFLFLGPTGVGKTETAKALAQMFFGSETRLTRFDMSEYQGDSIARFLGDFRSGKEGVFASSVRQQPYTVVLLDEFEKADQSILNLFLAALDEGFITDAFGKKVFLTNTIIIATSNAGAQFIREYIQKAGGARGRDPDSAQQAEGAASTGGKENAGQDPLKKALIEHILHEKIFSPELINRFDDTIVFHPLEQSHVQTILDLMIKNLNVKLKDQHDITVTVTPETRQKILTDGFSPEFGARQLARSVQKYIENPLSEKVLKEEVKRGEVISI